MSQESGPWVKVRSAALSAEINPLGAQLSVLRDRDCARPALERGRCGVGEPRTDPVPDRRLARGRPLSAGQPQLRACRATVSRAASRSKSLRRRPLPPRSGCGRMIPRSPSIRFRSSSKCRMCSRARRSPSPPWCATRGTSRCRRASGFHPGLRWPLPYGATRGAHFIEFEADESAPIRRINAEGLLTPRSFPTPVVNRRLVLSDELFRDDVLILDQLQQPFGALWRRARPQIGSADFPTRSTWGSGRSRARPSSASSRGRASPIPRASRDDFTRKPGVFIVAPGASHSLNMGITLRDG